MQVQQQVKNALKELPPAERVVAIALRNIYEEIKNLHAEERKQIDKNHMNFIGKFRDVEKRTGQIIKGKTLSQDDLFNEKEYFVTEQEKDKKTIMEEGPQMKGYWAKVFKKSSLHQAFNEADDSIIENISSISTNVTTDHLEIEIEFSQSDSTTQGKFSRKLKLTNGSPSNYDGDDLKFKIPLKEGFFETLNSNSNDVEILTTILSIFNELINEIVPYSLEYYMGVAEEDDDEDFQCEIDEDDEEDDEEDGQPEKKVKNE